MDKIGDYTVVKFLGAGATSIVYHVKNSDGESLILKKLRAGFTKKEANRIKREEAIHRRRLHLHDSIAHVKRYEYIKPDHCLLLEYAPGIDLAKWMSKKRSRPKISEILQIAWQVCDAIGFAHSKNVIHHDIKPSNIIVDDNNRTRLIDFECATVSTVTLATISKTGGTLHYAAPEQFSGKRDNRSDIYSIGCVMYEMITGIKPYEGQNQFSLTSKSQLPPPKSIYSQRRNVPKRLVSLVDKAMHMEPSHRFQSAYEVRDALEVIALQESVSLDKESWIIPKWKKVRDIFFRWDWNRIADIITEWVAQFALQILIVASLFVLGWIGLQNLPQQQINFPANNSTPIGNATLANIPEHTSTATSTSTPDGISTATAEITANGSIDPTPQETQNIISVTTSTLTSTSQPSKTSTAISTPIIVSTSTQTPRPTNTPIQIFSTDTPEASTTLQLISPTNINCGQRSDTHTTLTWSYPPGLPEGWTFEVRYTYSPGNMYCWGGPYDYCSIRTVENSASITSVTGYQAHYIHVANSLDDYWEVSVLDSNENLVESSRYQPCTGVTSTQP